MVYYRPSLKKVDKGWRNEIDSKKRMTPKLLEWRVLDNRMHERVF